MGAQKIPFSPKYDVSVMGLSEAEHRRYTQENFKQIIALLYGYSNAPNPLFKITLDSNGTQIGKESEINFINGNGMSVGVVDDNTTNFRFNVTVSNTTDFLTLNNQHGSQISAGQPVTSVALGMDLANASDATKPCIGICIATVNGGANGTVQSQGLLTLADWTAATGGVTLTVGARYFLDSSASGKLTTTPDISTAGKILQFVGNAESSTALRINVSTWIGI